MEKTKLTKPKTVLCCCCGVYTKGRQWHNRDKGYGICPDCARTQAVDETADFMQECYGEKGYHYDVKLSEPPTSPKRVLVQIKKAFMELGAQRFCEVLDAAIDEATE